MDDEIEKEYFASTDKTKINSILVHQFLSEESYWAKNIPLVIVQKSIDNSLCFGVYNLKNEQVAFARVVTDFATFGYLADVFVIESHRGKGISKFLMDFIMHQEDLQGLRRWILATRNAHSLYTQFSFQPLPNPQNFMTIHKPDLYASEPIS